LNSQNIEYRKETLHITGQSNLQDTNYSLEKVNGIMRMNFEKRLSRNIQLTLTKIANAELMI
jgi:hypothetical protein